MHSIVKFWNFFFSDSIAAVEHNMVFDVSFDNTINAFKAPHYIHILLLNY